VGGDKPTWAHLEKLRENHTSENILFLAGGVYAPTLKEAFRMGEQHHETLDESKEKQLDPPPFFAFHIIGHQEASTRDLVVPLQIARHGFGFIGEPTGKHPPISLYITMSQEMSNGDKKPLFRSLDFRCLEDVKYYGAGHGDGLFGPLPGKVWGLGAGCTTGFVRTGVVLKATGAFVGHSVVGHTLAVLGVSVGLFGSPIFAIGAGAEWYDRRWKNHYYDAEKLWNATVASRPVIAST